MTTNSSSLTTTKRNLCPTFSQTDNDVTVVRGIKGLASGVFFDNLGDSFLEVSLALDLHHRVSCSIGEYRKTSRK